MPAVELQNPLGDVVEEVAIVRDGDDRAVIFGQVPLEPVDGFGVEMVRRLVEQQQVGLLQQHLAQRHAPPLAAGERCHVGIAWSGRFIASIAISSSRSSSQASGRFDLVLQTGHLVAQLLHLVVVQRLAELGR